ncbi:MAG: SHOCT-like domain-containing protein [Syntrophothermus sp.]
MSSEERRKILQMVEEGKITAEQAASLMRALEVDQPEAEIQVFEPEPDPGPARSEESAPEFEEVKARARRWAMIPLWSGVIITIFSAWGIYAIINSFGTNYWWVCLLFPLFIGILLIVIGAGGPGMRWLYVNVDRRYASDGGPRNITLGFPLPLGLASWFLRNFGHTIHGLQNTNVDDIIQILDATNKSGEPLIVNVNDNEDGERVQVYIG